MFSFWVAFWAHFGRQVGPTSPLERSKTALEVIFFSKLLMFTKPYKINNTMTNQQQFVQDRPQNGLRSSQGGFKTVLCLVFFRIGCAFIFASIFCSILLSFWSPFWQPKLVIFGIDSWMFLHVAPRLSQERPKEAKSGQERPKEAKSGQESPYERQQNTQQGPKRSEKRTKR